jgi:hypothetical protein
VDAARTIPELHRDRGLWWCGNGAMVGGMAVFDIYQSTGVAGMFWMAVVVIGVAIVCGGLMAVGVIGVASAAHEVASCVS